MKTIKPNYNLVLLIMGVALVGYGSIFFLSNTDNERTPYGLIALFIVLAFIIFQSVHSNRIKFDDRELVYFGNLRSQRILFSDIIEIRRASKFLRAKLFGYQMLISFRNGGTVSQITLNENVFTEKQIQQILKQIIDHNSNVQVQGYQLS